MHFLTIILILGTISAIQCAIPHDSPVVQLRRNGKLRGVYMPGFQTRQFEAFMGIPYAKPPVGELRFANPVFADPIIGTYNATAPRADCIQKNYLLKEPVISGEEDCLYLNVYRPIGTSHDKKLPVMVYIHGGGFFSGTPNPYVTGPEYFMDSRKVIVVTMAYRLGALGFLSTGDDSSPGNYALKDQRLALRWVHKYIEKFGGRKDLVTIFGQSAGGASVHMHMLTQKSPVLFQRAIIISGNAAAPYNDAVENPLKQAHQQAEYVGILNATKMTTRELIAALRNVTALEIVEAGDKFKYWQVDPLTEFRCVIEKNSTGAFLTRSPKELIETGDYSQIPWMITFVPYEGAVRALSIVSNETLIEQFNENFNELLIRLMQIPYKTIQQRDWYVQKLVDQYMNGKYMLTKENARGFGDMITGRAFVQPMNFTIEHYKKYGNVYQSPLYLSKFNYRGNFSYSILFAGDFKNYGVVHCDDLIYLLHSPALKFVFEKGTPDYSVSEDLVEHLVTFAIDGNPKKHPPLEPCSNRTPQCEYTEYKNREKFPGFQVTVSSSYDQSENEFWNNLIPY